MKGELFIKDPHENILQLILLGYPKIGCPDIFISTK